MTSVFFLSGSSIKRLQWIEAAEHSSTEGFGAHDTTGETINLRLFNKIVLMETEKTHKQYFGQ